MKNKIANKMRKTADWLMFGSQRRTSMLRLFSTAPFSIPLVFWAAILETIPVPKKEASNSQ